MKLRSNNRAAIVGATGTGKTYLAERLVQPLTRVVVIDPKGSLATRWGLEPYDRRSAKRLMAGDPVRAHVSLEPGSEYGYDDVFATVYSAGNCVVYIDEIYGVVPPGTNPPPYLSALYTRGRELGIGVIACTQRPVWCPLFVFSESDTFFAFRLMLENDRKRMAEFMGPRVMTPPPDKHGFYVYQTEWAGQDARYYAGVS